MIELWGDNNVIALGSSFFRKRAMAKARALSEALGLPPGCMNGDGEPTLPVTGL